MEQQYRAGKSGLTRKHSSLLWTTSKAASTDPDSIPLAIPIDPTASVAFNNLNGAAGVQPFWRNQTETCTGSWSSDGVNKLDALCNKIAQEGGEPELLVTTRTVFQFVQQQSRGHLAINASATKAGKQLADMGIPHLSFNGIPLIHDVDAVSGRIYALHSDAIEWVPVSGGDYSMMGDGFESTQMNGVMASVAHMRLEGFLRVRNRRLLGQVDAITAA